jgi:ABC-type methionine transport system permease subunit
MFETVIMADSITNYATVSGVIVGVLLFVVRARRKKGTTTTATSSREERKVKYDFSGRPISD